MSKDFTNFLLIFQGMWWLVWSFLCLCVLGHWCDGWFHYNQHLIFHWCSKAVQNFGHNWTSFLGIAKSFYTSLVLDVILEYLVCNPCSSLLFWIPSLAFSSGHWWYSRNTTVWWIIWKIQSNEDVYFISIKWNEVNQK